MFWSWQGKKSQRAERKNSDRLRLTSGVDKLLPQRPSFDGYNVEVLAPEEAHRVLKFLARRRS